MGFRRRMDLFGHHPDFLADFEAFQKECREKGELHNALMGRKILLSSLQNNLHPDVCLIPRNKYLRVMDEVGDTMCCTWWGVPFLADNFYVLPFSSFGFLVDYDNPKSIFWDFFNNEYVLRMRGIRQLGFLLPSASRNGKHGERVYYDPHFFSHSRFSHCMLAACLMDVILALAGFSKEERAPLVFAAGTHDIGMPGDGDAVKKVDPDGLCEERNYAEVMIKAGLDEICESKHKSSIGFLHACINGKGWSGELVSVVDRIAYVAADCYYFARVCKGDIRGILLENPSLMDFWKDIRFTPDKKTFYFSDVDRLFMFQLLRAYEHVEFLYNPYCRAFDQIPYEKVKKYYDKGIITRQDLLENTDAWLDRRLDELRETEHRLFFSPDNLGWMRFNSESEANDFCAKTERRISHREKIKQFDVGFSWLVMKGGRIIPFGDAINSDQRDQLLELSKARAGWYVYYHK